MGQALEERARFVADTPWEAIPKAVREHAKLVLLDTLGVMIAGSVQPEVAGVRGRLTATGGGGRASCGRGTAMAPARPPYRSCRPRWPAPNGWNGPDVRRWPR